VWNALCKIDQLTQQLRKITRVPNVSTHPWPLASVVSPVCAPCERFALSPLLCAPSLSLSALSRLPVAGER
jgi:hypothetical protein